MIDPGEVDELERPAEALDPPAVALPAHRAPVVHGLAPELAVGVGDVRGGAGLEPLAEEAGVCHDVGAVVRDIDRDVADQAIPRAAA